MGKIKRAISSHDNEQDCEIEVPKVYKLDFSSAGHNLTSTDPSTPCAYTALYRATTAYCTVTLARRARAPGRPRGSRWGTLSVREEDGVDRGAEDAAREVGAPQLAREHENLC
eukprot:scaffold123320_cov57-Phaeocystis_antarctica.AAC.1